MRVKGRRWPPAAALVPNCRNLHVPDAGRKPGHQRDINRVAFESLAGLEPWAVQPRRYLPCRLRDRIRRPLHGLFGCGKVYHQEDRGPNLLDAMRPELHLPFRWPRAQVCSGSQLSGPLPSMSVKGGKADVWEWANKVSEVPQADLGLLVGRASRSRRRRGLGSMRGWRGQPPWAVLRMAGI